MTTSYRYTLHDWECPPDGEPLTIELDLDVELGPYDPGNTYGPPEFCEPPSGGEIESLELSVVKATHTASGEDVRPELLAALGDHLTAEYDKGGALQKQIDDFVYEQPFPERDGPDDEF